MLRFFNSGSLSKLRDHIKVSPAGFRYGFLENVFREDRYQELVETYPPFSLFHFHEDGYKKVFEGPYYDSHDHAGCDHHLRVLPAVWQELLREAASDEFIQMFRKASGVEFNSLRNFSFKYGRKGCEIRPHLDQASRSKGPGASRLVSMWYFSSRPGGGPGGTAIYDRDRKTILFEAPVLRNSMLFFEQHPEVWHGYETIKDDSERHALALTYNQEPARIPIKDSLWHELFCVRRFRATQESPASKIDALMR